MTSAVRAVVPGPLWVKLTGQSEDVAGLAAAAVAGGADAVGLMGRYMALLPDPETMAPVLGTRAAFGGGWALPLTCHWLAAARGRLGPDVSLIGTNGARSGLDVVRMLLAGARAVEMTSVVMAGGPAMLGRAVAEVAAYADTKGVALADIVGRAADRIDRYADRPLRPGVWRRFVHPEAQDG
jgi:dihydroorotate dehydrogenase